MDKGTMDELRRLVHLEEKRREFDVTACQGKHKFITFTDAQNTIRPDIRHLVNVYHCTTCKGYHIGNNSGTRKKRLLIKRRNER